MLKKLGLAALVAALLPGAALAQPWYRPYDNRDRSPYYEQDRGRYGDDDDRYGRNRDRAYRDWGQPYVLGHPAYDQYGPDPNGTIAPDGHRIKCKLVNEWNGYYGEYLRRRACW
jgi:hypothetical protein